MALLRRIRKASQKSKYPQTMRDSPLASPRTVVSLISFNNDHAMPSSALESPGLSSGFDDEIEHIEEAFPKPTTAKDSVLDGNYDLISDHRHSGHANHRDQFYHARTVTMSWRVILYGRS